MKELGEFLHVGPLQSKSHIWPSETMMHFLDGVVVRLNSNSKSSKRQRENSATQASCWWASRRQKVIESHTSHTRILCIGGLWSGNSTYCSQIWTTESRMLQGKSPLIAHPVPRKGGRSMEGMFFWRDAVAPSCDWDVNDVIPRHPKCSSHTWWESVWMEALKADP